MPRSTKAAWDTQVQAGESIKQTMTGLDESGVRHFNFIKKYAKGIGLSLSDSVVVRWCLLQGYLTLMEQLVRAYEVEGKDKVMEQLVAFQKLNRKKFLESACKVDQHK